MSSPKPAPTPPPPPPPPPPIPPVPMETAKSEGSKDQNANGYVKGRKSLRIDLASSNAGGASGLNLPVS